MSTFIQKLDIKCCFNLFYSWDNKQVYAGYRITW